MRIAWLASIDREHNAPGASRTKRLADIWSRSRWPALFAPEANQYQHRNEARPCVELSDGK